MCGSWRKGSHLGSRGGPACQEGEKAGSWLQTVEEKRHRRWPKAQETGSPHLQETFMHRVSAIVHCIAVTQHNHNRNRVSLYYLSQENKSFGTDYHLHSSSDLWEVVLSTRLINYYCALFSLILHYSHLIYPFTSHFLFFFPSFFLFLSLFFLFLIHLPPFSLPLFRASPPNDIS